MAWPTSRSNDPRWWIVRRQRSFGAIEPVDQDLVQTQIRGKRKLVRGIEIDRVRVRRFLTLLVHARSAMLDCSGRGGEKPIGADRQNADASAAIICNQYVSSRGIDDQVTGTGPVG